MDAAFLDYPSVWLVLVPGFGFGRFEGTPPTGPIFTGLVLGNKPLRTLPATKEPLVTEVWLGEMPGFQTQIPLLPGSMRAALGNIDVCPPKKTIQGIFF